MKIQILLLSFILSTLSCASISEIYDTKNQKFITIDEIPQYLPAQGFFILGEFHAQRPIQNAQAQLIRSLQKSSSNNFDLAWEFLNHPEQNYINTKLLQLREREISTQQFLIQTAGKSNLAYAPIIEILHSPHSHLRALNISRSIKQKVIQDGLGSIDPQLVPDFHYNGGASYYKRFQAAMGNHVPANKLEAYFTAQCLTDSVMAQQLNKSSSDRTYAIIGSFHTDFFQGTVERLKLLTNDPIVTFKFVLHEDPQKENYINGHQEYGAYADYIIFTK